MEEKEQSMRAKDRQFEEGKEQVTFVDTTCPYLSYVTSTFRAIIWGVSQ